MQLSEYVLNASELKKRREEVVEEEMQAVQM